jgi:hypothetical protein
LLALPMEKKSTIGDFILALKTKEDGVTRGRF